MADTISAMWNRFAPRMRRAISGALEEAGRRGHELALPEHLLLRIAADRESAAVFMLEQAGLSPSVLIEELSRCAPGGAPQQRAARFASATMHVLDLAVDEADRREDLHVGTEHVALALTRIDGNLAIVDKRLSTRPYILGERATIADLSLVAYLYYPADEFGFDVPAEHKKIAAWLDRIKALPGWKHPYDLMPGYPLPDR